ncbi:MAG: LPXTG cell wall anchor domain-containing protein [Chloroflexota bacterium]
MKSISISSLLLAVAAMALVSTILIPSPSLGAEAGTPAPTATGTPVLTPPVPEILARGQEISFTVCAKSSTWTRPSAEDMAAKWSFGRWKWPDEKGEKLIKYPWTHFFFVATGSASIEYDLLNLSGVSREPFDEESKNCIGDRGRDDAIAARKAARVWLLLHRLRAIKRLGTYYVFVVEPTDGGFQFVDFPVTAPASLTLYFVAPDGKEIDKIVEGVTPWTRRWGPSATLPRTGSSYSPRILVLIGIATLAVGLWIGRRESC